MGFDLIFSIAKETSIHQRKFLRDFMTNCEKSGKKKLNELK